ncbi:ATP-grasp domain-containing protein [Paraburkholderia sp. SARCC-3016]|uniref:ATP-grasp domain-containing protein n=1 Tax=Paraburkholderia sp. SARCC-3016 TaxID=3058611 RepID=UPI0028081436|nr:ATP-grasp domain-containing protein [Paraburkholderia sp. SARCC-3016]MDQ7978665.1 ATP-grasp domain-containing protein [Paraburkholderia sp. SARCC-3016]
MKTVVFIETNFSGLDAIAYCRQRGYRSVLVTDNFERFRKWFPASALARLDLVDKVVRVPNSNDLEQVSKALEGELDSIDALLTFAEIRTHIAARLCRELGLRGANPDAIALAQDKYRFRRTLLAKGADSVRCRKIDSIELLPALLEEPEGAPGFPCFVKPVQGHSSIGAMVCRDRAAIGSVLQSLRQIDEDWISPAFVVEDYLEGALVSAEILTTGAGRHQIVGIADRDVMNGAVEIGASFPLVDAHREAVERKACAALDAIGYDFGASHVEMIVTRDGPHLVEVNTRVGGSGHSVMLDLATSRSIVGDCIELCLGTLDVGSDFHVVDAARHEAGHDAGFEARHEAGLEATTRTSTAGQPLYQPRRGAAWKCFVSPTRGKVVAMPSIDAIRSQPGVHDVWLHREPGDTVADVNSNFSWIAQVMCVGRDRHEAKLNAARAVDFIAAGTTIAPIAPIG